MSAAGVAHEVPRASSLAARLSRPLTAAVVAVWVLSTTLVAVYVDGQIQRNFDLELAESAHRQLTPTWMFWQAAPGAAAGDPAGPLVLPEGPGDVAAEPLLLQLRKADGEVVVHSRAAPQSAFAAPLRPGLVNIEGYRVLTLHDAQRGVWLQLADSLAERREASWHTVGGLVAVLLLMLPVLAGLIHAIARRELRSVMQLHAQITERGGRNLQPLQLQGMPRELQALGQEVNGLLQRLEGALQVERSLAANAAHELRTPLAQLQLRLHTAIDQAQYKPVGPAVPVHEVQAVGDALQALSHRTERLLQLSRAQASDRAWFRPVDVVQLCEQVAQEFWQQPRARKRLDWLSPDDTALAWVLADVDSLAIVLRNWIDNALHHTQAQVVLGIQVLAAAPAEAVGSPQVVLLVRDAGLGLSTDALQYLQQRHVRHSPGVAGYGLGTSIVRSLAEHHGAEVQWLSPPPGQAHWLEMRWVMPSLTPAAATQAA